jgi:dihydrofolate reductase
MRINLIYARAANGVIGLNNAMPWHLPEDLAQFRRYTQSCPVVMGRATWESLPAAFRPLPKRVNMVLTRQPAQAQAMAAQGAVVFDSLPTAIEHARHTLQCEELWVMGGAQIYQQAEPLAQRAVVTEIQQDFEGDAYAPTLGPGWHETQRKPHNAASGLRFDFVVYER